MTCFNVANKKVFAKCITQLPKIVISKGEKIEKW